MRYIFWVLFFLAFVTSSVNAELDTVEKEIVIDNIDMMLELNPRYLWGGTGNLNDLSKPTDCSEAMTKIFRKIRPVKRTRAREMLIGTMGWAGKKVFFESASSCSLIYFDMKGVGYATHTGVLYKNTLDDKFNLLCHASEKRGFIRIPIEKSIKDFFYPKVIGIVELE